MVLNLGNAAESPGELIKDRLLGPSPWLSHSVGTGQGLKISSKCPHEAGTTRPDTMLWETKLYQTRCFLAVLEIWDPLSDINLSHALSKEVWQSHTQTRSQNKMYWMGDFPFISSDPPPATPPQSLTLPCVLESYRV